MSKLDETRPFIPLNIALLTVSDTRSLEQDRSGELLSQKVEGSGHKLCDRKICKDDINQIHSIVESFVKREDVDVVITTGGTGFTGRDVTPEAIEPLFEKRMDGFSTIFHQLSFHKIGTSTIQSRAVGGVANATYIFALPGSTGACKDAWDGILKWQLDYRYMPCNFVEILPRLDEHLKRGTS